MALRIGELAKQLGLATSALRYYEESGLLKPATRTEAGYRLYEADAFGRLAFIQRAQALGLSVKEIRELIESPEADNETERTRLKHVVAHKLADAESRLSELSALKSELEGLYVRLNRAPGPVCGHVGDCACWLPTEEEVITMATDIKAVKDCGCDCCPEPGCDCGCCGG